MFAEIVHRQLFRMGMEYRVLATPEGEVVEEWFTPMDASFKTLNLLRGRN